MCEYGTYTQVLLNKKTQSIDSCIASLVRVLNKSGIKSWASCCGHQKGFGSHGRIDLKDGRILIIGDTKRYSDNSVKYLFQLAIYAFWHKIKHNIKWKTRNLAWKLSIKRG